MPKDLKRVGSSEWLDNFTNGISDVEKEATSEFIRSAKDCMPYLSFGQSGNHPAVTESK